MWNKTTADLVFQFLFRLHTTLLASYCNSAQNGGKINIPPSPQMLSLHQLKILCQKDLFSLCVTKLRTLKFIPFQLQPPWTPATHSNKWMKCLCDSSKICSFWSKALNVSVLPKDNGKKDVIHEHNHSILDFGEYWETHLLDVNKTSALFIAAKPHLKR